MKTLTIYIVLAWAVCYTTTEVPPKGFCDVFKSWSNPKTPESPPTTVPDASSSDSNDVTLCRGCQPTRPSTTRPIAKPTQKIPAIQNEKINRTTTDINTPEINRLERINSDISECITRCPATPENNPVCGTNNITYGNVGKLRCAKMCGINVDLQDNSACSPQPTSVGDNNGTAVTDVPTRTTVSRAVEYLRCTKSCYTGPDYDPVCGTDLNTYVNKYRVDCAKSCGRDIDILCHQPCPLCAPLGVTAAATFTI